MKTLVTTLIWTALLVGCSHRVEETILYPAASSRPARQGAAESVASDSRVRPVVDTRAATSVSVPVSPENVNGPTVNFLSWDRFQIAGQTLLFGARGEPFGEVQYQWQFEGKDIPGATNPIFAVESVGPRDEGRYRVVVSNKEGRTVSAESRFRLLQPPSIVSRSPDMDLEVPYQSDVSLRVVVDAPGQTNGFPLYYQWSHDGTNLTFPSPSAPTSPTHTFPANQGSQGTYSLVVSNAAGRASTQWRVRVKLNTLAYNIATNLEAYTRGRKGDLADMRLVTGWSYTFYNATNLHLLSEVKWSTNCWLSGVRGLTATPIAMSNNLAGQTMLTMVSPRHYLSATHVSVGARGVMLAFLDRNNRLHWRRSLGETAIGDDISVGVLDQDLPPTVGFLPVLPADFNDYLPRRFDTRVQGIGMNQDLFVFTHSLMLDDRQAVWWDTRKAVPFGAGTNWNVGIRGGDSSLPVRLLLGDQLVLVSQYHMAESGPMVATHREAINRAMRALSSQLRLRSDYQLTAVSLAGWPKLHGARESTR
jgi:hypothetical protein